MSRETPLDAIRAIYKTMPQTGAGALVNLSYDEDHGVNLEGYFNRLEDATRFADQMEKSGAFIDVQIQSTRAEKSDSGEMIHFRIAGRTRNVD